MPTYSSPDKDFSWLHCSTAMETKSSYTIYVALERIFCTMKEVMVVETVVLAEKYICWLLLVIGSLPYDLLPEVNNYDRRFALVDRVRELDAQNDDASKAEGCDVQEKCDSGDHNVNYMPIGSGSDDDDDNDNDEDARNDERGNNDGDEDGDDGYSEDDYDKEDDGEEYEDDDDDDDEDEEEEEEIEMSVDTTDSENDDDADDRPGYGSLLRHAREVYAATSFYMFKHEYNKSKTLDVDVSTEDHDGRGLVFKYKIQKIGHRFNFCIMKWQTKNGNQLMAASSVKKSGSKDDSDMRTKHVGAPPLRHAGGIFLVNYFRISQETLKRSEYLSLEPVCETFGDGELFYDGEAREHKQSRYHVDAPLLWFTRDIYKSNVYSVFREEYKKSEHLSVMFTQQAYEDMGLHFLCEVRKPRHSRSCLVLAEAKKGLVKCTCKLFEKTGILCRHALAVMDCLFIEKVPPRYILEEFMKNPGIRVVEEAIHGDKYPEFECLIHWIISRYDV